MESVLLCINEIAFFVTHDVCKRKQRNFRIAVDHLSTTEVLLTKRTKVPPKVFSKMENKRIVSFRVTCYLFLCGAVCSLLSCYKFLPSHTNYYLQ